MTLIERISANSFISENSLNTRHQRAVILLCCLGVLLFAQSLFGQMTKQDSAQAIIYHPHVSIPQLNESDKLSLIHTATIAIKDFFSGKNELPDFPSKYDSIDNRVYVILRKDGQRRVPGTPAKTTWRKPSTWRPSKTCEKTN